MNLSKQIDLKFLSPKQNVLKVIVLILVFITSLINDSTCQIEIDSNMVRAVERQITKKEKRLNRMLASGELIHPVQVEYQLDEFRIEEYINRKLERDPATGTYISELILAEKRYRVLLSKYYNKLSKKLKEEDREILEESQTRWQAFKRYEQEVNKMINPEAYKLATIPMEQLAERHLDIVKFRVTEIIDYISRLKMDK